MRSLTPTIVAAVLAATSMTFVACGGDDGGDDGGSTGAASTPNQTPTGGSGGSGGGGNAELSAQVAAGEQVYASSCAMCHGDNGSGGNGPAVIGENADLSQHDNGQGLLDYISENMPASSPGSLTDQQYLDVTAYILEADGALEEPLSAGNAADVQLPGG